MPALPEKIVLASGNRGKRKEIERLLQGTAAVIIAQSDLGVSDADETGTTFAANALIKARNAVDATSLPAIADDSGLLVDALDGRPGVYSARYAGPDATDVANIDQLLAELDGVAEEKRGAAFHCSVCLLLPGTDEPIVASAEWRGRILTARQGESGFGYDPVFFDIELGKSAAELPPDVKNARSHRGQALQKLLAQMRSVWDLPA